MEFPQEPLFPDPLERVVAHSPASTGTYLGSPSLALVDGTILASHDFFGPGSPHDRYGREYATRVYRSDDDGLSWKPLSDVRGAFWSSLLGLRGSLYLFGVSAHYGDIVIRRSDDLGRSWTEPVDEDSGLLFRGGPGREPPNYHCAPVPLLESHGRIWRGFEDNRTGRWPDFDAIVVSSRPGDDLLRSSSWRMSEKLRYDRDHDPEGFAADRAGWLEGNLVESPDGTIYDLLRVNSNPVVNKAAMVRVSEDGRSLAFDPASDFINFPGGMSKFTIRYDAATRRYVTLSNQVFNARNPWQRNVLVLASSPDLLDWTSHRVLLYRYQDERLVNKECKIGFQYPDWVFEGEDIVCLVRTAVEGAHNYHDANYITYHRVEGFREMIRA
jgi:hypothetical protein